MLIYYNWSTNAENGVKSYSHTVLLISDNGSHKFCIGSQRHYLFEFFFFFNLTRGMKCYRCVTRAWLHHILKFPYQRKLKGVNNINSSWLPCLFSVKLDCMLLNLKTTLNLKTKIFITKLCIILKCLVTLQYYKRKKNCICTPICRIFTQTKVFKYLVLISKGKYHLSQ